MELWTIVNEDKLPVPPYDCNPDFPDDEGMLVYRSREAAMFASDHQNKMYDLESYPVRVSDVLNGEVSRLAEYCPPERMDVEANFFKLLEFTLGAQRLATLRERNTSMSSLRAAAESEIWQTQHKLDLLKAALADLATT